MTIVFPLITGRATTLLTQNRLAAQLQNDQLEVLRIQDQLSTGRRITAPSQDAPAALRAIELQRILEQKVQAKSNVSTGQSYLAATDTALSGTATLLTEVRGLAVQFAGNTLNDSERESATDQIRRAIQQLINVGNETFRGRSLFGGSRTTEAPFNFQENQIEFRGNDTPLNSYGDIDLLFPSNVIGREVFGGLTARSVGVDLSQSLTTDTRLENLRGGLGIASGRIIVSDGNTRSTIDLRGAETVGDVIQRIEASPPDGREVFVRIDGQRLTISLDAAGAGTLTIREADGGTTANDLGILELTGVGVGPLTGRVLEPLLTPTTRLENVLGARAQTVVRSAPLNNDIELVAKLRGPATNGYTVRFVDDSLVHAGQPLSPGDETVTFVPLSGSPVAARASLAFPGGDNDAIVTATTPGSAFNNVTIAIQVAGNIGNSATASYNVTDKRLTIGIDDSDETTLAALQAAVDGTGLFTISGDGADGESFNLASIIPTASAGLADGNTGNSGGEPGTIFVNIAPGQTSANDVVSALQADPNVAALFDVRLEEKDSLSGSFAGTGLVDVNATATTSGGSGLEPDFASGLRIVNAGQTHTVSFAGAATIEDVLNILNRSDAGVLARISEDGTGISVQSRLAGVDFSIGENGGTTAEELGLRTFTRNTLLADLNHGRGVQNGTGDDFTIQRRDGTTFSIEVSSLITVGDVLDAINSHPSNTPPNAVTAQLASIGNGIELVDPFAGPTSLTVTKSALSQAALDLGLIPAGQSTATTTGSTLTGRDVNPQEVDSVFNALLRLADAIETDDSAEIERTTALLDDSFDRVSYSRAELGHRQQTLDILTTRLEDEETQLRSSLSLEIDTDFTKAISDLLLKQASVQASLNLMGRTLQLTLFDFV